VKWTKIIRRSFIALLILMVLLGGVLLFLKSGTFRNYAVRKIEQEAAQSTGARVQIGSLDLTLSPFTAILRNIVLRGTEPASNPPLAQIDELTVGISVRSLLHRKVNLNELLIKHPVINVSVNTEGQSNIPQPPPSQSHTNVFDLAIGHFALTNGEIAYKDKKIPLNASLDDLHAEVAFNSAPTAYRGSISYSNGELAYARYPQLPHSARVQFTATPSTFSLDSAVLTAASSTVSLKGELRNFNDPTANAEYDIHLHPQDFAAMSPGVKAEGDVHVAGAMRYENKNNQSFIRSLVVNGQLQSNGISATTASARVYLRAIQARYELENANLRANDVAIDAFGGQVTAKAEMRNLDTTPVYRVRAVMHSLSLREMQRSIRQAEREEIAVAGTLNGFADAGWTGNIENVRARSDLTVRGGAKNAHANSAAIPIDAVIHAAYDGPRAVLTLRQSTVRAPSLTLTADGEVSKRSSLKIHAQANDLHQLLQLASSFSASKFAPPAVSGSAVLDTTVQGSLRRPQVSGQLDATNLHVQGSDWKSAALSFTAASSEISVSNGSLVNANQGRAAFSANIALHDWHYEANNPIRAELSAQKLAIADLQHVANVHYPVSGDLSAHLSLAGTELNPSGSGSVDLANARAYGEPIQTLALRFNAANGSITSNLNIATGAGSATTTLAFTPKTRAYKINLDAPAIVLQKFHRLQSIQGLKATVSASVNGEGTLDNPQLTAIVKVAQIELQQKSLGDLNANVQIANKRADLNFVSQLSQASIRGRAQVDLTDDFQTDASIDTNRIPLNALLASFSSGAPEDFKGVAELHATLKGPLKDKTRIEAHVTIPTLNVSYQQLQIGAAAPIRADYEHSVITLQPAEIRGTDTSMRLQGSIPIAGSAQPSLTAQGEINMRIARIFVPDLQSSGTVAIDLRAAGSPKSPSLQGQIRLQNVSITTPEAPLGVDKLNGVLNVDSNKLQIASMTANAGSGDVSLGGGVTYRPALQFALALQGKSVRLRYPEGLRSVLDTNLALSGNMQAATLNGRVLIDSLSFTPEFDLSTFSDQFSGSTATPAQPGFADNVKLNLSVQSKQNLSATSSQVSIEGSVNLNVIGTAANPVVTGRTLLTSGELFYRGNRYQLQRGIISFADLNQTNPDLNVSVTTTVEQYNLTINLRGTLDRLTTSYSSDPPLATTDIIHLIAFGNTASESAASSAGQSTDAMVAASAVGAGLTSGIQKLAGFSSLQIDPLLGGTGEDPSARIALQQRVTKNFLFTFSTDVSQPGQEIVQGDYQINQHWSVNVTRDQVGGITVSGRLHTKF
jgi:translocation and assembly module TamB